MCMYANRTTGVMYIEILIISYVAMIFRILPVDLGDPEATRAATEKATLLFGGNINILINNAGS